MESKSITGVNLGDEGWEGRMRPTERVGRDPKRRLDVDGCYDLFRERGEQEDEGALGLLGCVVGDGLCDELNSRGQLGLSSSVRGY